MPTIQEMRLLDDAMADLAGTLQRNKEFKARQRLADSENTRQDRELGLQERMMQMRERSAGEEITQRREAASETARHHKALEDYQREIKALQSEGNADRRNEGMFKVFQEMGQNGMLTDEALKAMEGEFQKRFGNAGVGVRLFKLPPKVAGQAPEFHTDPETGTRFATHGNQMMHSGDTGETEVEETDPDTGQRKIRRTRKLGPKALNAPTPAPEDPVTAARVAALREKIKAEAGKIAEGSETTLPLGLGASREGRIRGDQAKIEELLKRQPQAVNPPQAAAPAESGAGDLVRVITPKGERKRIRKADLEQALREGYKLNQ